MTSEGVLGKSITSGKWLTMGYILQKLIGLLSFFILARILKPADFGIMAFVLLVPKFLQATTDTGLSAAAIQKKGYIKQYLNTIWTIGVIKSVVIFILIYLSGPYIANFLNSEDATLAIRLGGIFILVQHLSNIGEIYFFKNLDFKKIFIRNTSKQLLYVLISVTSVVVFKSYWALFIGNLAMYLTHTISTYALHPYRPKLSLNFKNIKNLFSYSKWIVGQGWLTQAYGFIESTVIGKITGANSMGLYSKGKNLAAVVPGFISSTVNMVSFPAYSKLKESTEKIKEGVMKSFDLIFFITIPVLFLILILGKEIVIMLIGDQWLGMINVFKILTVFFIINLVIDICYTVFNAVGQPDKKVKYDSIKILITIFLLSFLTYRIGIDGASYAILAGSLPVLFITINKLIKITNIKLRDIIMSFLIPTIISVILFVPVIIFKNKLSGLNIFSFLSILCIIGLSYLFATYKIGKRWKKGPYKTLLVIKNYIK